MIRVWRKDSQQVITVRFTYDQQRYKASVKEIISLRGYAGTGFAARLRWLQVYLASARRRRNIQD
jgi:hypothetical protein